MTDAELTILSLVAEGPRYGYEIQQIVDERGLREWLMIGFSSIYYVLNKLENQKMLTSSLRSEGRGPARKVYEITEAGQGILKTAISELLRQPRSLGTGFELGLVNLPALNPQQVYKVLSHHREDLERQLEATEKAWERHQEDSTPADYIRALYTHSIAVMRAELAWLSDFVKDWCERYPDVQSINEAKPNDKVEPAAAKTVISRRQTPDPAKIMQRLKRPSPPAEE